MTPDYAQIIKALARYAIVPSSLIHFSTQDVRFVRDMDAMRYDDRARPLTRMQEKSLRTLAQKYRAQLPAEIVALAGKMEPRG
jgi:hypothetical protein